MRATRESFASAGSVDQRVPDRDDAARIARGITALERAWGEPPIRARTMGGTVPIDFFIQALGMPAICVPVVNFDNNQHSDNENLRLQNLWDAVKSFAAILQM